MLQIALCTFAMAHQYCGRYGNFTPSCIPTELTLPLLIAKAGPIIQDLRKEPR